MNENFEMEIEIIMAGTYNRGVFECDQFLIYVKVLKGSNFFIDQSCMNWAYLMIISSYMHVHFQICPSEGNNQGIL